MLTLISIINIISYLNHLIQFRWQSPILNIFYKNFTLSWDLINFPPLFIWWDGFSTRTPTHNAGQFWSTIDDILIRERMRQERTSNELIYTFGPWDNLSRFIFRGKNLAIYIYICIYFLWHLGRGSCVPSWSYHVYFRTRSFQAINLHGFSWEDRFFIILRFLFYFAWIHKIQLQVLMAQWNLVLKKY